MSAPAWSQVIERNRRRGVQARGGGSSTDDETTLLRAVAATEELCAAVTRMHAGLRRSPLRVQLRKVDAKLRVAVLRGRQLSLLPPLGQELPPLPRLLLELKAIRREHDQALSDSGLRDGLDRAIRVAGGGR